MSARFEEPDGLPASEDGHELPQLGRLGIWRRSSSLSPQLAADAEAAGYGAVWVGGSPTDDLDDVEALLAATQRVVVVPAIVNIWANDPARLAASYHRVTQRFGDRVLLGVGSGHRERAGAAAAGTTFASLVSFLDVLQGDGVPPRRVLLGALGPRTLRLASRRTAGAHTYLVTPGHTRATRELIGGGPLLIPEHKVCLTPDPAVARAIARAELADRYFKLGNYRASLLREGFTESELDAASPRALDALVFHGDATAVGHQLRAHLDAGADHVAVQLLDVPGQRPGDAYRALAAALLA